MNKGEEIFGTVYEQGEVVFRQGELGDTMYIIQSGAVEVSQLRDDRKVVLSLLERGDFFGEMSLIDKHPRTATVTTIHRTRLLPLTRDSFLERARVDPGVVLHLLRGLSKRIEKTNNTIRSIIEGDETLLSFSEASHEECIIDTQLSHSVTKEETESQTIEDISMKKEFIPHAKHFYSGRKECVWFEPGEIIFRKNDAGDTMYLILEGEIEISEESEKDKYLLAHLYEGDFFGEMAILTDQPRAASASAIKRTLLLPIRRDEFLDRVKAEPDLALYILQVLIMRLRMMLSFIKTPEKKLMSSVLCSLPPPLRKGSRVRTALISLSSCGGCPAALLADQERLIALLEKIHISYCPMLMDEHEIGEVEVAVVDGAIRVKEDEEKLLEARQKSRFLVAWGTCAAFGGSPAFADQFESEELIEESYGQSLDPFAYYLSGARGLLRSTSPELGLDMFRRVRKLDDFVKVDYYIPGCPPDASLLIQFVKELKGEAQTVKPRPIVCSECGRKTVRSQEAPIQAFPGPGWEPDHCFISKGALCMGFVTKGGCGAVCPRGGLPCWGCRGPSQSVLKNMDEGKSFEEIMLASLSVRTQQDEEKLKPLLRIAKRHGNSSLNFKHNFVPDRSRIR